jgi:cullin 3
LSDSTFDQAWSVLSTAFEEIYNKNASDLSFEVLYRNAYSLVLHKDGDKLYAATQDVVHVHLLQVAGGEVHSAWQELVNAPGTREYEKHDAGVRFLKAVRDAWEDHILCMRMISDVLMYLVGPVSVALIGRIVFMSSSRRACRCMILDLPCLGKPWYRTQRYELDST